jgi:hypothetical protein
MQKTTIIKNGVTTETIISNGTVRQIFIIPITSRKKWWQFWKEDTSRAAKEEISKLISDYKEKFKFDEKTGEIFLPDTKLTYQKDIWFPSPNYDNKNNEII